MKYVINEKMWIRGNKDDKGSYLLRTSDQKMCCLGFVALQNKLSKENIADKFWPSATYLSHKLADLTIKNKWPRWFVYNLRNTKDCEKLMSVNDNPAISDFERKKQIRAIFKKHGDTIVFSKGDSK